MSSPSVEHDNPKWPEPFAAMYARIRYQSYLFIFTLGVILIEGILLYRVAAHASAHVFEVHPDGRAIYIGDRMSNLAPRPHEARRVAKDFAELLYGWNSSTVHLDLAEAVAMCNPAMRAQLRAELASAQYVDTIRDRAIRSEIVFHEIEILDHGRRHSQVRVAGEARIFPITAYETAPIETKAFALVVVMAAVERSDKHTNGLEIVRIIHDRR